MNRRHSIIAGLAFLAVSGCDPLGGSNVAGGPGVVSSDQLADTSVVQFRHADAINAVRNSRGLASLRFSQALNSAALTHARDMALQQRAWHFGSDRSNPLSRAKRAGYGGQILGENISESFDGDIETLQNWLSQGDASSIILDPRATSVGFGWFQEPTGKIWWVQVIGTVGGLS